MSLPSPRLSEDQKDLIRGSLLTGCDREASANAASATLKQLNNELKRDPEYAKSLLKAEGSAELLRMSTMHSAAKDKKQWRAAAWWLEQKAKKRFARRKAKKLTTVDQQEFVDELADMILSEVAQGEDRERLLTRLFGMANDMEAQLDLPENPENQET